MIELTPPGFGFFHNFEVFRLKNFINEVFKEIVAAISFFCCGLRTVDLFHRAGFLVDNYLRNMFTTLLVNVESGPSVPGVISYLIGDVILRHLSTSSSGSSSNVARNE